MEPQVSVPMAKAASPAPVMAAEPLDDPQVQYSVFQGFLAAPVAEAEAIAIAHAAGQFDHRGFAQQDCACRLQLCESTVAS